MKDLCESLTTLSLAMFGWSAVLAHDLRPECRFSAAAFSGILALISGTGWLLLARKTRKS